MSWSLPFAIPQAISKKRSNSLLILVFFPFVLFGQVVYSFYSLGEYLKKALTHKMTEISADVILGLAVLWLLILSLWIFYRPEGIGLALAFVSLFSFYHLRLEHIKEAFEGAHSVALESDFQSLEHLEEKLHQEIASLSFELSKPHLENDPVLTHDLARAKWSLAKCLKNKEKILNRRHQLYVRIEENKEQNQWIIIQFLLTSLVFITGLVAILSLELAIPLFCLNIFIGFFLGLNKFHFYTILLKTCEGRKV